MIQVNVRIGIQPVTNKFICTINGINKPLDSTLELVMRMSKRGVNNRIVIDGEYLYVAKVIIEDGRIIAEAHSVKHY